MRAIQLHKKNKSSKMNYLRDRSLKGYKYDIDLVKDPVLFICTARKVPHALCDQVKRAGPRKRRYYPLNTLEEIATKMKGSQCFTQLDCRKVF